ncbi:Dabb family protein [Microbacterium sp. No. 7]|uniref:Dabb family protein n=1 Tax=Microbacterium sp. No. 7 TaxID=1714373 RepID=UPI0006D105C1|nr:Dabb family protein [Microbacterium sp. No. 7]ALJ21501.1 stress responsive alpha-beta barrel domain-containing protein [Microbacterium sp. No. 7]
MTIRHVLTLKMAAPDAETRAEHAAEVARRIQALDGVVPTIRSLSVGVNSAFPDVNADVGLIVDFDDLQGLEEYQVHPAHKEVIAYVRSVMSERSAVDFEV